MIHPERARLGAWPAEGPSARARRGWGPVLVCAAELEPLRPWQWFLHNQRGVFLDRAIRHGTANVVICRIRFRATTWSVIPGS